MAVDCKFVSDAKDKKGKVAQAAFPFLGATPACRRAQAPGIASRLGAAGRPQPGLYKDAGSPLSLLATIKATRDFPLHCITYSNY